MSYLEPPVESSAQPTWPPTEFVCEVWPGGRAAAWIRPRGELDIASTPEFEQVLNEAGGRAALVIVDLRELSFMDSTGVRAIIEADARARSSARGLAVVRGPSQINRLFELVGVSDRLEILDPQAAFDRALTAPTSLEAER